MRRLAIFAAATALAACSHAEQARTAAPDALIHPTAQALAERAPDTVRIRFETGKGSFVVEAYRDWAPRGVDRLEQLTKLGFFDGVRFFRVIDGFMAQFGLHGDPRVTAAWEDKTIPDDSVRQTNARGTITFATRGPNTRSTQFFINLVDNKNLDGMGFTPIGRVVEGMGVVDSLYKGYGEGAPQGSGPDQGRMTSDGNAYLQRDFPKLDSIIHATVVRPR